MGLSTDFYGPLPSGEYLLVIIDDYSRFPVVELVRSTYANTVIPVLDKVLSTFGTPDILKSDNGAPFNSGQFHSYAENMGFKHRKVTPYWPRANGEAERFMKNLGSHENIDIRRKAMETRAQQVSEKISCDYPSIASWQIFAAAGYAWLLPSQPLSLASQPVDPRSV